jgi:hypothetical protein
MAKSKSSSKSLVSSIESVLPKGISLIHVLLAIGLGIMICSFLNESRVEGLPPGACNKNNFLKKGTDNETEKAYTCLNVGGTYQWFPEATADSGKEGESCKSGECQAGLVCGSDTYICEAKDTVKLPDKTKTNGESCRPGECLIGLLCDYDGDLGSGKCVLDASGNYAGDPNDGSNNGGADNDDSNNDGAGTGGWAFLTTPATGGVCKPNIPAFKASCSKFSKAECISDGKDTCGWIDCGGDKDSWSGLESINLKGTLHDNLVTCLGGNSTETPDDPGWYKTSELLPISGAGDKELSQKFDNPKNFLKKVGCKWDKTNVTCANSLLPIGVKEKVAELGNECAKGWEDFPTTYQLNGGGPIMSFNSEEGLHCKNPLMERIQVPGTVSRLLKSKRCGKDKCPCRNNAVFEYEKNPGMLKNALTILADNTITSNCHNPNHAKDKPLNCLTTNFSNFIGDAVKVGMAKIGQGISMTGDCDSG